MTRSVWVVPEARSTSRTRSSAPAPPPRSRVPTSVTGRGAPSSQTPVMTCRRSKCGRPEVGPTTKVVVASPVAVDVAPSNTRRASMDWTSTGTTVVPPVVTGGGARSKLVGMGDPRGGWDGRVTVEMGGRRAEDGPGDGRRGEPRTGWPRPRHPSCGPGRLPRPLRWRAFFAAVFLAAGFLAVAFRAGARRASAAPDGIRSEKAAASREGPATPRAESPAPEPPASALRRSTASVRW